MKRIIHILILLSICAVGHATHNRAGQLLFKHISGNTYEFTQIQFFYSKSAATWQRIQNGIKVSWGDNKVSILDCVKDEIEELPDDYIKCVFRGRHTFPGARAYFIVMEDANRNLGIANIPNSVSVVFCVTTAFRISPNIRPNNSPELLTYPIDKAALGRRFVHNPSAFDIDGDSLSYELGKCLREGGQIIETYTHPQASDSLYVDPVSGDFVWDAPVKAGIYSVAMKIHEWRNKDKINTIVRDMQIEVVDSKNQPPKLPVFKDTCVIAGESISITFEVTDPDDDFIVLTATGGPFQVTKSPATLDTVGMKGKITGTFTWKTDISHVRKQPYTVLFKAKDKNREVELVSFANYNITVIAREVEILPAIAEKKHIRIEWNPTIYDYASGYEIYRSIGRQNLTLGHCDTGIPSESGYERIATINGINKTTYNDSNNARGFEYCYRVVVIFSDGAKSLPSDETCASLLPGLPPMIQAHVDKDRIDVAGKIDVAWLEKPVKKRISELVDQTGPFEYRLFHTTNLNNWPANPLYTSDFGKNDTIYPHDPVDTKNTYPHYYKVELWDTGAGKMVAEDSDFEIASTLYPILQPSDESVIINFGRYTPWVNTEYDIYRCTKDGVDLELIEQGWSKEPYIDRNLHNGQEYCYRIESKGYRIIDGIEYLNENGSHIDCVTPYDNVAPCEPELIAKSFCSDRLNQLDWEYPPAAADCWADVEKYRIYYSPDVVNYHRIDSVMNRDVFTYLHRETLVGCYYVTAVDSAGNESRPSIYKCLDECGEYELPNVFTPNGDNINDIFKSYNPGGVKQVDMKIFNRSGKLVFKTEDPNINWDGRDIDSKRFVATGVYYYICDVFENRLTGPKTFTLTGFIHVYYGKNAQPYVSSD